MRRLPKGGVVGQRPPGGSPKVPATEGEGGEAESPNQLWRGIMAPPPLRGGYQRGRLGASLIQVNLDHARLATGTLRERMTVGSISLAAVSDPYRPSKKIPHLPVGFGLVASEEDPGAAVIYKQLPFDVCHILVTNLVVAVYCRGREFDFVVISAYAPPPPPPTSPWEPVLQIIEGILSQSKSLIIVVAGDFNAKHLVWGPNAGDDSGARLLEFRSSKRINCAQRPQLAPHLRELIRSQLDRCDAGYVDCTAVWVSVGGA
ncbi:hypothetical protein MRX96_000316 [Rhipicephalus microplus]